MKGHFSVEWLSQSSLTSSSQRPTETGCMPALEVPQTPSTSGTVAENLPGFYSRCWPVQDQPQEPITEDHLISTIHQQKQDNRLNFQHCAQGKEADLNTEEEETSGYESEGGHSVSPGVMKDSSSPAAALPPSGRRPRTAFTAEQINCLEKAFKRNTYLGTQDKADLCKRLNLSDKQIRNWFQNRRMKLKRTVHDALAHACQAKVASHLMQYPELQTCRPAPYPQYYPTQDTTTAYMPPTGLHYNRPLSGHLHGLSVDALYQLNGLPALAVGPATSPRMVPYQPYPHQF